MRPAPARERGAVLIAALVILLILTVLGISGMQSTTLEERMAGNMRSRSLAFQGAEAALRINETALANSTLTAADFDGTDGLYQPAGPGVQDVWETVSWGTSAVRDSGDDSALDIEDDYGLAANPEVVMEGPYMIPDPGGTLDPTEAATIELYRVTSRSVGQTNDAVVILQSVFRP
jgi:type IV pilus assembly protein PilX